MPSDENRPYQAKNAEQYTDEEFLNVLSGISPPASTAEVAGGVGCSLETAKRRLNNLMENGTLYRKRVGNSFVWSVAEE